MTSSGSAGTFRPFKDLKKLLEKKSARTGPHSDKKSDEKDRRSLSQKCSKFILEENIDTYSSPESERKLFLKAMADVEPISRGNRVEPRFSPSIPAESKIDADDETLRRLDNLVKFGEGFVVEDTPEYIEGIGYHVHPEISKRLHRGKFSIQANIDLHGLGVEDARMVFEDFLKESVLTGKRAVLVVHGRGLSSPNKPVLKTKVVEWLTLGPWRKWVIAFSSARSFDGGAGATYVLLRQRPITSRYRKKMKNAEPI